MRKFILLCSLLAFAPNAAVAEQGCPPGQYPIGGQGVAACAPIPQGNTQQAQPRPLGKWINTWGAVAIGSIGLERNYGASTGKHSKAEAERDALARCSKHGEQNCEIGLSYYNQCVAVGEPQIDQKPNLMGKVQFFGSATLEKAATAAQAACESKNPTNTCKIIYNACTDQIFQKF